VGGVEAAGLRIVELCLSVWTRVDAAHVIGRVRQYAGELLEAWKVGGWLTKVGDSLNTPPPD